MTEATPEDVVEQEATATRDAAPAPVVDLPTEADPFDVAEQAAPVGAGEHVLPDRDGAGNLPLEADPADAAEQAVVVEDDEDEHR